MLLPPLSQQILQPLLHLRTPQHQHQATSPPLRVLDGERLHLEVVPTVEQTRDVALTHAGRMETGLAFANKSEICLVKNHRSSFLLEGIFKYMKGKSASNFVRSCYRALLGKRVSTKQGTYQREESRMNIMLTL